MKSVGNNRTHWYNLKPKPKYHAEVDFVEIRVTYVYTHRVIVGPVAPLKKVGLGGGGGLGFHYNYTIIKYNKLTG